MSMVRCHIIDNNIVIFDPRKRTLQYYNVCGLIQCHIVLVKF